MSALVDYSSSGDDDNDLETSAPPSGSDKPELPPLPSTFRTLYATNVRSSNADDPSLHGGRTRQVPHTVGNWPSHVYIEWSPTRFQAPILKDLIKSFHKESEIDITSLLVNDIGVAQPLHISLSRSLQVATDDRTALLRAILAALDSGGVYKFHVIPSGLKWVPNYDGTRWFLALALQKPQHDRLNQLLRICNSTVQAMGHPPLYAGETMIDADYSDYFHFSLAWALSSDVAVADTDKILEQVWSSIADKQHKLEVLVDSLIIKLGNAVHHKTLNTRHFPQ